MKKMNFDNDHEKRRFNLILTGYRLFALSIAVFCVFLTWIMVIKLIKCFF